MAARCFTLVSLLCVCAWTYGLDLTRDAPPASSDSTDSTDQSRSTFESWPSSSDPSPASVHSFILQPSRGRYVYGRVALVQDPLRSLSVLEPGGAGGCERQRLVPAAHTALSGGCEVAVNAGFYNASSGACLGNVVSDGRLVTKSPVYNAQFGIRKDGRLVFGYLSEEDLQDQKNPFVQLVSGVVWLLRDGQVYINHSLQVESDENQSSTFHIDANTELKLTCRR
ncbi:hypothetical protein WMY93_030556 [Mugilogobius chulae]|uniref:Phosphodiester glycosidase domain-containing protein n=1 Tax=Mugilogobius chulae TaxID=88201 RepID=A0AAW0MKX7_9GOBI